MFPSQFFYEGVREKAVNLCSLEIHSHNSTCINIMNLICQRLDCISLFFETRIHLGLSKMRQKIRRYSF